MTPLDLVRLTPLIDRTSGRPGVAIGLIDGPVAMNHPELASQRVREILGNGSGNCTQANSTACLHGTFVAGILFATRRSVAPAICPHCTLLVRPIFAEMKTANGQMPSAMPEELAQAILDCIDAGAHVLNVSAALAQPSIKGERALFLAAKADVRPQFRMWPKDWCIPGCICVSPINCPCCVSIVWPWPYPWLGPNNGPIY